MEALLEGLEISIVRLSDAWEINPSIRLDPDFFSKAASHYLARIKGDHHIVVREAVIRVQHPIEVTRQYEDKGLLTVMAKNVRDNRVDLSDPRFMPEDLLPIVSNNLLESGDVLMTRTGANFGQVAPWKLDNVEAYGCADVLIFRNPSIPTGYLSSYLASTAGKTLVRRGGYGMAQPHVAPSYLNDLLIPRFDRLESRVDRLVDTSVALESESSDGMRDAERTLLSVLGLADWKPPEPLAYSAKSADVFAAARFDARYHAPRIRQLVDLLSQSGSTVGTVAKPRRERFNNDRRETFDYIEIGDVEAAGTVGSSHLQCAEAPSRATWHVHSGDVITSTVRPIRRLSAQIGPGQEGYVCSSGFVVLTPTGVAPEVLLTFLRLPAIRELMDLHTSASMYPAISETDILALPFPTIQQSTSNAICAVVQQSRETRQRARDLLNRAKRAVEIAIEDSEAAALRFLDEAGA